MDLDVRSTTSGRTARSRASQRSLFRARKKGAAVRRSRSVDDGNGRRRGVPTAGGTSSGRPLRSARALFGLRKRGDDGARSRGAEEDRDDGNGRRRGGDEDADGRMDAAAFALDPTEEAAHANGGQLTSFMTKMAVLNAQIQVTKAEAELKKLQFENTCTEAKLGLHEDFMMAFELCSADLFGDEDFSVFSEESSGGPEDAMQGVASNATKVARSQEVFNDGLDWVKKSTEAILDSSAAAGHQLWSSAVAIVDLPVATPKKALKRKKERSPKSVAGPGTRGIKDSWLTSRGDWPATVGPWLEEDKSGFHRRDPLLLTIREGNDRPARRDREEAPPPPPEKLMRSKSSPASLKLPIHERCKKTRPDMLMGAERRATTSESEPSASKSNPTVVNRRSSNEATRRTTGEETGREVQGKQQEAKQTVRTYVEDDSHSEDASPDSPDISKYDVPEVRPYVEDDSHSEDASPDSPDRSKYDVPLRSILRKPTYNTNVSRTSQYREVPAFKETSKYSKRCSSSPQIQSGKPPPVVAERYPRYNRAEACRQPVAPTGSAKRPIRARQGTRSPPPRGRTVDKYSGSMGDMF